MKFQRTEASVNVSDFKLTEVGKEEIKLNDLVKTFKTNTKHVTIKNQFKKSNRSTLQLPLTKPQAEKIKRVIAYEKATNDLSKWDNIIQLNRSADQIVFPLKKPEHQFETNEQLVKRFQPKNELEQQIADQLRPCDSFLSQAKELTKAEEKFLKAMSLEEAKARHAELRKMRLLLSQKEMKARRQKKIKSKKYHRILKKEKMKKLMKEFEELRTIDPVAAKEKIEQADKLRILERMTLKHKGTGKWAKQQKIRAKYNPESRKALKEQRSIGHTLAEKASVIETIPKEEQLLDSDDDDGNLLRMYMLNSTIDHNKRNETRNMCHEVDDDTNNESLHRKRTLEDFENLPSKLTKKGKLAVEKTDQIKSVLSNKQKSFESNFGEETVCLDSLVPDDVTFDDEGIDDIKNDTMTLSEAFANEDIIAEFKCKKANVIDEEMPKGNDSYLPGWGSWGGNNIKALKKKHERYHKLIAVPVRKDQGLSNIIIPEKHQREKATDHQVSELPFPYKSNHQFCSIMRQPIGSSWNPESSFQKLIAPSVVIKLGEVIDPIDADDLEFKNEEKNMYM